MKTFVIFKREGDQLGEKLASYQAEAKNDVRFNYDKEEPQACHLEVPESVDVDCAVAIWGEVQAEQVITLEEAWTEEVEGEEPIEHPAVTHTIPAVQGWLVQQDSAQVTAKRQAKANANLAAIRALRQPVLMDADHSINEMEDNGEDASALRAWRKALRECTDNLKKVNGDAKFSCENLVPEEFEFPAKPE